MMAGLRSLAEFGGCVVGLALLAVLLGGCSGFSCPKGQGWGITGQYWVPTVIYPGREEQEHVGKYTEEIWVPGYTVYGHWVYIWGCKQVALMVTGA